MTLKKRRVKSKSLTISDGQLLKNPQRHGKRYTIQPLDC